MKREYIQPRVDIVNLTSTTSFLTASTTQPGTETTTPDSEEWTGDGNDFGDDDGNTNTPADPWA